MKFGPVVQEMSFKDISYLAPWWPFCSAEWNHLCNFFRRYQEEQFCDFFEFGPVVQMSFKDISYLEPLQPCCSAKQNHLCNFGRGYQEEQFCEIILNLDQWLRMRYHLKVYLFGALAALVFGGAEPLMQFS